jgi:hypothetical protein
MVWTRPDRAPIGPAEASDLMVALSSIGKSAE